MKEEVSEIVGVMVVVTVMVTSRMTSPLPRFVTKGLPTMMPVAVCMASLPSVPLPITMLMGVGPCRLPAVFVMGQRLTAGQCQKRGGDCCQYELLHDLSSHLVNMIDASHFGAAGLNRR